MKLFKFSFRSSETETVDAVELWEVRWESRYGEFSRNTKPEVMVFTSEDDAKKFRDALKDAFKLIRHSSGTKVIMQKIKNQ